MWTAIALSGTAAIVSLLASSHREAPFVTEMPKVDATDFYMFRSYEPGAEDTVTLIANYIPLQDAYGGPNYFTLDPDAFYDLHVDTNGDAVEDLTFRFQASVRTKSFALQVGNPGQEISVPVPLINIGPFDATNGAALNRTESFRLSLLEGPVGAPTALTRLSNAANGATTFPKPVDNIGSKSIPDYETYEDAFLYDLTLPDGLTGRVFVGQRKDPFVVNLGETFDLINTNPLGPVDGEEDDLADANVTAFCLELPIALFGDAPNSTIGAWTTARLPRQSIKSDTPTFNTPETFVNSGDRVQVSRLGMPLVNEVVIGLPDKNKFNASPPSADGQFVNYVTNPTLPELIEILFPSAPAPNLFPRADLVQVFLTGVPGLNDNGSVAEMQRLNMTTPVTPADSQNNLGVIGGDNAGYPNGRRPGDDVVDISLRVVMGALLDASVAPAGAAPFTDGAFVDASFFDTTFPYLRTPLSGSN